MTNAQFGVTCGMLLLLVGTLGHVGFIINIKTSFKSLPALKACDEAVAKSE